MADLKPTALLVEDEKQIRRFRARALEDLGWIVHESETLAAGLSAASTRNPGLIILDLGLPDGDGMDFLRTCAPGRNVPVIVLSARDSEEDKIKALDSGADDYLTKPFAWASCWRGYARPHAAVIARRRRRRFLSLARLAST